VIGTGKSQIAYLIVSADEFPESINPGKVLASNNRLSRLDRISDKVPTPESISPWASDPRDGKNQVGK